MLIPETITQMADQGIDYLKYHEAKRISITAYEGDGPLLIGADSHANNLFFVMSYNVQNAPAHLDIAFFMPLMKRAEQELGYRITVTTPKRPPNDQPLKSYIEMIPPAA